MSNCTPFIPPTQPSDPGRALYTGTPLFQTSEMWTSHLLDVLHYH